MNYPGFGGDIAGFNNKYVTLADQIAGPWNIGSVVRLGNHFDPSIDYSESVVDDLRSAIACCEEHSRDWFDADNLTFFLMGFSAGAGAVAALAGEVHNIEKILLAAPSAAASHDRIQRSLARFPGECYSAVGTNDDVVGAHAAHQFSSMAKSTRVNKVHLIENCDHQFRGTRNGRIMASLPLWAFTDRLSEPDESQGVDLY